MDPLIRGFPGHPLHPPLTDAVIGMYTLATGLAVAGYAGWFQPSSSQGAWLALVGGLIVTVPTAVTGFLDWVTLEWGGPAWRTATAHLTAMLTATLLFALAAWQDYDAYNGGDVSGTGLVLTLVAFGALTAGGWLGGTIVFVHGVRVLERPNEPAREAASPRHTEVHR